VLGRCHVRGRRWSISATGGFGKLGGQERLGSGPLALQGEDHGGKHLGRWVPHLPRLFLRIGRIKIGKQLGVSKAPQSRAIVSHDIGGARDVREGRMIAMVALMKCL
jgi:hypothetical protein